MLGHRQWPGAALPWMHLAARRRALWESPGSLFAGKRFLSRPRVLSADPAPRPVSSSASEVIFPVSVDLARSMPRPNSLLVLLFLCSWSVLFVLLCFQLKQLYVGK